MVKKLIKKKKSPVPIRRQSYIFIRKLKYRKGLYEKIKRTCEKYQIRLAPELGNKIKNFLPPLKQTENKNILKRTGVIYKIPCSCEKFYIGETGRELHQRILEHQRAIRLCRNRAGLDRHVRETGHNINWSNITILGRESHWQKRKLKENLEIEANKTQILNDHYHHRGYSFNQLRPKLLNPGINIP